MSLQRKTRLFVAGVSWVMSFGVCLILLLELIVFMEQRLAISRCY